MKTSIFLARYVTRNHPPENNNFQLLLYACAMTLCATYTAWLHGKRLQMRLKCWCFLASFCTDISRQKSSAINQRATYQIGIITELWEMSDKKVHRARASNSFLFLFYFWKAKQKRRHRNDVNRDEITLRHSRHIAQIVSLKRVFRLTSAPERPPLIRNSLLQRFFSPFFFKRSYFAFEWRKNDGTVT